MIDKVSVVVPAYNESKYLAPTLEKIRNQNGVNIELIVVDNNSTDNTRDIAEGFADKVVLCKKQGASSARNMGAKSALNNYLAFCDADTSLQKDTILICLNNMPESVSGIRVRYSFPPENTKLKFINFFCNFWLTHLENYLGPWHTPFLFTRREQFYSTGGFNEEMSNGEEIELQRELKRLGRLEYLKGIEITTDARRFRDISYQKLLSLAYWGFVGTHPLIKSKVNQRRLHQEPVR